MKKIIVNIMTTTGISLVALAIPLNLLYGLDNISFYNVFTTLGVNIVLHLGLLLTHKFESKYFVLEALLDIGYIVIVLSIWGALFDWMPIWMLAIMGVLIYLISLHLSMVRIRAEVSAINKSLQRRNVKK